MEFNEGDIKVRDPFQTELMDAVKKRSSKIIDENYNFESTQSLLNEFDPQLNRKMSKYQAKLIGPDKQKTDMKDFESVIEPKKMLESEINYAERKGLNTDLRNNTELSNSKSTHEDLSSYETEEKAIDRRVSRHKKEYGEQRRDTFRLENELEQLFSSSNPAFSKEMESNGNSDRLEEDALSFKPRQHNSVKVARVNNDEHNLQTKENEKNITSPTDSPRRPKPRPRSTIVKSSEVDKTYLKENNQKEFDFIKSTPKGTSTPSLLDSLMDDENTQPMHAEKREIQEVRKERKSISNNFHENHGASKWNENKDERIIKPDVLKRQTSMKTPRSIPNDSTGSLERKRSQHNEKDKMKSSEKNRTIKNGTLRRSSSLTNISNIQPKSLNELNASGCDRQNAITIRERVYYEWLHSKTSKSKEEMKGQSEKAKMEEKEKEDEKLQKKIMAEKTFSAWSQTKEVKIKEKKKSIKISKLQEKEEEDEKLQKKLDGKKFFESWKQRKDEVVKEQFKKKQRAARRRKQEEEQEQKDKKVTAQKVFENWKSKKADQLQTSIEARTKKQKEERLSRMAEYEKKKEAEKAYDSWKNNKQLSPRQPTSPALTQRSWRPNGTLTRNAIPEKVQPVVIRHKRTLSASGRLQINKLSQR